MENRDGIIKKIKEKISNRRDEKSYIEQQVKQQLEVFIEKEMKRRLLTI